MREGRGEMVIVDNFREMWLRIVVESMRIVFEERGIGLR